MIIIEPIPITDAILTSSNVTEADYTAYNAATLYNLGDYCMVVSTNVHKVYRSLIGSATSTVTCSVASPCVIAWTAHGQPAGTPIYFTNSGGGLPTGIVANTVYYVLAPTASTFNISATVGGAAINTTGTDTGTDTAHAGNINKTPASNPTVWLDYGATNRWKMFDQVNNTQTANATSIVVVLAPVLIASGFYVGNVDADSVTLTVTDAIEGVVYSETQSLSLSTSGSSFYKWYFGRILKKTYAVSVLLPPYANASISITLTKTGGTAKCGLCAIGPLVDVGLSQYGLGTEIKDYSTTLFAVDGTSTSTLRSYSKRMTVDVMLDNDVIDSIQDILAGYRQTPVVWIGATMYGSTMIYGKYSSFKNVIPYPTQSKMALQIEGMI